jgi:hypothetical protein
MFSLLFIKNIFNRTHVIFIIIGSKLHIALSFYKLSKIILFDCIKIYWYVWDFFDNFLLD